MRLLGARHRPIQNLQPLFLLELIRIQLIIIPLFRNQLLMRPIFRNLAILNHQNPIRRANRRESMRNDEARPPRQHLLNRVLNQLFRLRINRGRGLVQHENRRVRQNRAGKGNQLLLPGGEAVAALANVRLITILHVAG